jgi:hypothetical protein
VLPDFARWWSIFDAARPWIAKCSLPIQISLPCVGVRYSVAYCFLTASGILLCIGPYDMIWAVNSYAGSSSRSIYVRLQRLETATLVAAEEAKSMPTKTNFHGSGWLPTPRNSFVAWLRTSPNSPNLNSRPSSHVSSSPFPLLDLARAIAILVSCLYDRRQFGVRSGHFFTRFSRISRSEFAAQVEPFATLRVYGVHLAQL